MKWTVSALELRGIADVLKDIISQVWFVFTPSGIRLVNVDNERVIAVLMEIRPPSSIYFCECRMEFSFYVQTLYKVLRGVKTMENAVVELHPGGDIMSIFVHRRPRYTDTSMSITSLRDPLPCFNTESLTFERTCGNKEKIFIKTCILYRILHDLSAISKRVMFDTAGLTIGANDAMGTSFECYTGIACSNKSIQVAILGKYLEKFCKPNLHQTIELYVHNNEAVNAVYRLEHGYLMLSIAPMG